MYVEELIGPDTVNTMPEETIRAFQDHGEVRGDTVIEGVEEAQQAPRRARARPASTTTTCRDARGRGRAEVRGLVRRAARRACAPSAASWRRRDASARARRADLGTRPDRLDGRRRGEVARLARRAVRMRERVDAAAAFADSAPTSGSTRRPARHGRLEPRAGGAAAHVPASRRSTSSTRRTRRRSARSRADRPRADALRLGVEVGATLETRSHTDYFWERTGGSGEQFVAITDPGSELERLAGERELRARLPRRADDRRPLLGALAVRDGAGGADGGRRRAPARPRRRDGRGLPARRRQPGLELGLALGEGWRDGRDKVCIDTERGGFGLWAEQLIAESTGQARQGARARARRAPRAGPPGEEVRLTDPYELGQEFFRWEFATAVAGLDPRDQPVRPARRAGGEGQDERGPRRRRRADSSREGSPDELFAQARGRLRLHPRLRRPDPGERAASSPSSPSARATRGLRRHPRLRARATSTRPGSCTRAGRRPGSSCRSSTTPATSSRSRVSRSASAADPRPGRR